LAIFRLNPISRNSIEGGRRRRFRKVRVKKVFGKSEVEEVEERE